MQDLAGLWGHLVDTYQSSYEQELSFGLDEEVTTFSRLTSEANEVSFTRSVLLQVLDRADLQRFPGFLVSLYSSQYLKIFETYLSLLDYGISLKFLKAFIMSQLFRYILGNLESERNKKTWFNCRSYPAGAVRSRIRYLSAIKRTAEK